MSRDVRARAAWRVLLLGAAAWLAVAAATGGARAQSLGAGEAERRELDPPDTAEQVLEASEEAALLQAPGAAGVRYADVLANPDDPVLNFRWANQQVADGDLKGAAATLERILILHPQMDQVRVFLAIVLFRLDDLQGAAIEFERLDGRDLPEEIAETVRNYRERIARRERRTIGSIAFSGGALYQSNRNTAPKSGTLLFRDLRFQLAGAGLEDDDYAYRGIAELAVQHRVGKQEQHTLFGKLTLFNQEQEKLDRFDTRSMAAEFGMLWRQAEFDLRMRAFGTLLDLSSEKFVRTVGGDLSLERQLSPHWRVAGLARLESFDYDGIPGARRAYERTGLETTLGVENSWVLTPRHKSELGLFVRNRSAQRRFYAYWGPELQWSHTWLPGSGQFVIAAFRAEWNRYKFPQAFVSRKRRRDTVLHSRLVYGAPLSFYTRGLAEGGIGEIVLSFSADYLWASSNLPNFTYDDLQFGFLVTKQFEL